ncbi:MAG: outer membrane protein assembly factor BamA [Candidatus Omnitrophica bacterium]|nr:outer membrane protein assembly factor BamA [Candidatus Omnitrophota bacterium]
MRNKIFPFIVAALFFSNLPLGHAQGEAALDKEPAVSTSASEVIKAIEIKGNKAISTETIMAKIKTRVGQPYYSQTSRDDIKRLYETGFFSDISLELENVELGVKVVFKVEERPVIEDIKIEGNKALSRSAIMRKLKTKAGQYFNLSVLKEDIAAIKNEYERIGLLQVSVDHAVDTDAATNKTKINIKIGEGKRVKIRRIFVDGNLHFTDRRIIGLIKTRAASILNAGFFKEEQFDEDLERIKAFYLRNGYLDIKVEYRMDYDSKGYLYLRLLVDEGKQYSVGSITVQGNEKFSESEILASLKTCLVGNVFTYDALKEDVSNIQGFYFGKGYIFVQLKDATSLDPLSGKVDIAYDIVENEVAYVDRIEVRGNLKTQDKVIRRELRINPGERFDGDKLKRSKERLYNLGFFEEVNYDTEPGTEANQRNLIVDVKEAKTGSLSFGGGYSSIDQFVGFVEIEQKNFDWKNWKTFTGAGQDLKLRGEMGSVRQNFELSFTEPWMFDRPISFGFDVYKRVHDKESDVGYGYVEKRTGGDLRLGKEFNEYFKGGVTYRLEEVDISDVESTATADLKSEEGKNIISSAEFALTRDTTDNVFNPSRGLVLSGSYEIAGGLFGGDKDFNKFFALAAQYFPLFSKSVLQLQARAGVAQPFSDQERVPIYERFYAGGANTIRGYEERSVGPVDLVTSDPLGGEALVVLNAEITVPLLEFIKGAVFMDTGNVWSEASDIGRGGFKTGVGFGVRIKTPIGPLKLDYGIPLNKQPGKENKEGRFHFSMSHGF